MANTPHSPFAVRLRQLRQQANLKQEDVAKVLNIHRTAYTKYETDYASPDQAGLRLLAELYHVSIDYLLGGEPDTVTAYVRDDTDAPLYLNVQELTLLQAFRQLPEERRNELVQTCHDEAREQKLKKNTNT